MAKQDMPDIREVEQFLYREARLLDDRERWDEWLELYTEDATYWMPYTKDQPDPLDTPSMVYEDKMLMEVRIKKLRHPRSWAQQPPSATSRVVSNVMIDGVDDNGDIIVSSSFNMLEFRNDEYRPYGGTYTHRLVRENGSFKIRRKRVDLISADGVYEHIVQVPI